MAGFDVVRLAAGSFCKESHCREFNSFSLMGLWAKEEWIDMGDIFDCRVLFCCGFNSDESLKNIASSVGRAFKFPIGNL